MHHLLTNHISRINNTQVDDAYVNYGLMSMYDLIEYSHNYSKTSGIYNNIVKMSYL